MKYIDLAPVLLFVTCLFAANGVSQETLPKMIKGGVLNGKATSLPKPQYPDEARMAKVGGAIAVQVTIDEGGNVIDAKAVSEAKKESDTQLTPEQMEASRLRGQLETSAEDAARQATFSQTLLNGTPVKVTGQIVYNFVSDDARRPPNQISGGILNGKAVSLPAPPYPPAAKAVNASGAVSVQVLIDENGNVVSAAAVSGHPLLRAAAESAARAAKFSPTLLSGQPVKVSGILTYNFVGPKKEQ